jgi:hypothetical protein
MPPLHLPEQHWPLVRHPIPVWVQEHVPKLHPPEQHPG